MTHSGSAFCPSVCISTRRAAAGPPTTLRQAINDHVQCGHAPPQLHLSPRQTLSLSATPPLPPPPPPPQHIRQRCFHHIAHSQHITRCATSRRTQRVSPKNTTKRRAQTVSPNSATFPRRFCCDLSSKCALSVPVSLIQRFDHDKMLAIRNPTSISYITEFVHCRVLFFLTAREQGMQHSNSSPMIERIINSRHSSSLKF